MKTLAQFFTHYKGASTITEGFRAFLREEDLEYASMSLAITGEYPEGLTDLTEAILCAVDRERNIDEAQGIQETYQEVHDITVLNFLLVHQKDLVDALDQKTPSVPPQSATSKVGNGTSLYERDRAYVNTYSRTKDHRSAVRAYCGDNKWAIENAKGTGNW